jgi:Uma2 family endonuclease
MQLEMKQAGILGEQRVVLKNISWDLFESLLAALGDNRSSRLAYDRGLLEIMTPLLPHEHYKRLIEKLIDILAEELSLNIKSVGSLTCKREDLLRGLEPDSGFYFQNEPLVRSNTNIDLNQDPPPDLMLEVDFSNQSLNKLPIYISLGVPEVWRYAQGNLQIYLLQQGQYVSVNDSPTFANIAITEIPRFLELSSQIGEAQMLREFRLWVRERLSA